MKILFYSILCTLLFFCSCAPQLVTEEVSPYYMLTVDGKEIFVQACGTTEYSAKYLQDTAVVADFDCNGQGAGFHLRGPVGDGQYQLDHRNEAWYKDGGLSYITDSLHKGTLTIRTIPTPTSNFSQYHIEGEISFQAIDKNSGKTINVTNGKFLLRKVQY